MKTVLITGANKGIGYETAKQMAQLGYFVYLGSRDGTRGLKAIAKLNEQGISNVDFIEIDVTDMHSVKKAKQELETQIEALDVLINNAGIAGKQPQNISSGDMDNLRNVFETNFFGVVQTTQQFIHLLRKSDEPVIINVSSELGSLTLHNRTQDNPNYFMFDAYSCSKTALNAFTVMLANELRSTVFTINSVSPGYTATDLNQHQGIQTAEEGAKSIVRFATMGKNGTTGQFFKDKEIPW